MLIELLIELPMILPLLCNFDDVPVNGNPLELLETELMPAADELIELIGWTTELVDEVLLLPIEVCERTAVGLLEAETNVIEFVALGLESNVFVAGSEPDEVIVLLVVETVYVELMFDTMLEERLISVVETPVEDVAAVELFRTGENVALLLLLLPSKAEVRLEVQ